mmetsp:Transcript_22719/g.42657  ORF Transcript_22719/g.42657 Transcript_22719/m.42657 type:complete len:81 (+) Transcript_22719:19-261(+)
MDTTAPLSQLATSQSTNMPSRPFHHNAAILPSRRRVCCPSTFRLASIAVVGALTYAEWRISKNRNGIKRLKPLPIINWGL